MKRAKLIPYLQEKFDHIEELPHTADVKYRISGSSLTEAFEMVGYAFSNTHVDVLSVEPIIPHEIEVEAEDLESLLFDFMTELIYILGTKYLIFSYLPDLRIDETPKGYKLKVTGWGEEIDSDKHDFKTEVKAMTYHEMSITFVSKSRSFNEPVGIVLVFDI